MELGVKTTVEIDKTSIYILALSLAVAGSLIVLAAKIAR